MHDRTNELHNLCSKISSRPHAAPEAGEFEFEIRQKSFQILRSAESFTPTWQPKKVFEHSGAANFSLSYSRISHKTKVGTDCARINETRARDEN